MTKTALITGASSGIGREFARQLAAQGWHIVAVARREARLKTLIAELGPGEHRYITADLANADGLATVADTLATGRFELLVNNAGYSVFEPFGESDINLQQNILAVNCAAVSRLAHAFISQSREGDALINLASIVSFMPTPAQAMYSASKAFVSALSECLWVEQQARGVYVMGLCPGITETEFIQGASGGDADGQTLPAALIQSSSAVIQEAMIALEKRKKCIVVTGRINRLLLLLPRFLSRHRLIKTLAVIGDPDNAL